MVDLPFVRSPPDQGSFSTDIEEEIIQEALRAVEKGGESVAVDVDGPPVPLEAPPIAAELETAHAKTRELEGKLRDEHEKLLRAAADLENTKKRLQREKEEVAKFANERLIKDFLPVYDNLDRALGHASSATDFDSFRKGVEMILKLFEDSLGRYGVKTFSAKGQPFDPTRHEAMTAVETSDVPPNHVASEVLKGFTLHERLVRPALVVVARPVSAAEVESMPTPVPAPAPDAPAGRPEPEPEPEPKS